jgi:hypothetical protein
MLNGMFETIHKEGNSLLADICPAAGYIKAVETAFKNLKLYRDANVAKSVHVAHRFVIEGLDAAHKRTGGGRPLKSSALPALRRQARPVSEQLPNTGSQAMSFDFESQSGASLSFADSVSILSSIIGYQRYLVCKSDFLPVTAYRAIAAASPRPRCRLHHYMIFAYSVFFTMILQHKKRRVTVLLMQPDTAL